MVARKEIHFVCKFKQICLHVPSHPFLATSHHQLNNFFFHAICSLNDTISLHLLIAAHSFHATSDPLHFIFLIVTKNACFLVKSQRLIEPPAPVTTFSASSHATVLAKAGKNRRERQLFYGRLLSECNCSFLLVVSNNSKVEERWHRLLKAIWIEWMDGLDWAAKSLDQW